MVRQRDVEARHACGFEQRHKDAELAFQHTGVAVVRVLLPDGKLVVNGQFRQAAAHGAYCFDRKTGAVFGAAAVSIGAVVEHGRAEAAAHAVAVDLHHVEPGLHGQHGGFAKAVDDLFNFALRHVGDVGRDFLVEQGAQLLHRDFFRQHAGHVFEHRRHVGIGLVQLRAELAVVAVGKRGQALVPGKAFFVEERFLKPALAHGHVADDDHRAAACCDGAHLGKILLVRKAEGSGGKNNTVFQFQAAVVNGAANGFIHGRASLLLLFVKGPAAGLFRWGSGWPGGRRPR